MAVCVLVGGGTLPIPTGGGGVKDGVFKLWIRL